MRSPVVVALTCGVLALQAPIEMLAQCSCQPPYVTAPYSGMYRVEHTSPFVPLSGLHLALADGIAKWTGMFTSHGSDVSFTPGGSINDYRVIVAPDVPSDGFVDRAQKIMWIDEEVIWDVEAPADYLSALVLHELGHVFGLDQAPPGCGSVMSDTNESSYRTNFSSCDQQYFDSYYVPGPDPCATDPGLPQCSPLLIDTQGNNFRLTTARRGVSFDINADGAPEQVGWTVAGSDDAWLAMDRNGNGTIDDGSELFGNVTPKFDDPYDTTPNGFEALKYLESDYYGPNVRDGVIDRNDAAFWKLLLWYDTNHNGVSEPNELIPVSSSPLVAIPTTYRVVERRRKGNTIRQVSKVVWEGGTRKIVDVWLAVLQD